MGIWLASRYLAASNDTKDVLVTGLTGAWTAFFAFIFLGISALVGKFSKREITHYNSLVNLSTELNEALGIIQDNIFTMASFKRVIISGNIYWGTLQPVPRNKKHLEELYDIDLINEVFTFFYKLRRSNDDMQNLQNGYLELKTAYIKKNIRLEDYVDNAKMTARQITILETYSKQLVNDLTELLARIRIQVRKDKPFTAWLLEKLLYTSGKDITVKELKAEKKKLEKELEETAQESREEIEKTFGVA